MKQYLLVFIMFVLVACSPSESTIKTAIAQTQRVEQLVAALIPTDTKQPLATKSSIFATLTEISKIPSSTPEAKITLPLTYSVSTGSCLGYETKYIPVGDPVDSKYCDIEERKQMTLVSGDTIKYESFMPFRYPSFCAIHTLGGVYVTSDVDITGLGQAICKLP